MGWDPDMSKSHRRQMRCNFSAASLAPIFPVGPTYTVWGKRDLFMGQIVRFCLVAVGHPTQLIRATVIIQ